ncbi:MAG: polyprenol monophosphomannose synthase [Candidatus Nanoarchaeia archaeon]|jgi:dolichol-phosphate mannosyltransferase
MNPKQIKVSVILPTYNETENVPLVIKEIEHYVKLPFEIIVVDDNSPDGTARTVEKLDKPNVRVIKRTKERGLVTAIQRGIHEAKGEIVVWMDCDLSHPPHLLPKLLNVIINEGYDIAAASRYIKGGKDTRTIPRIAYSWAINQFAMLLLTPKITDYTTGFVAVKKDVFKHINLKGNYAEYCIQFLYEAYKMGFKIKDIPYITYDRVLGETKTADSFKTLIGHAWNLGTTIIRLRFRPNK